MKVHACRRKDEPFTFHQEILFSSKCMKWLSFGQTPSNSFRGSKGSPASPRKSVMMKGGEEKDGLFKTRVKGLFHERSPYRPHPQIV